MRLYINPKKDLQSFGKKNKSVKEYIGLTLPEWYLLFTVSLVFIMTFFASLWGGPAYKFKYGISSMSFPFFRKLMSKILKDAGYIKEAETLDKNRVLLYISYLMVQYLYLVVYKEYDTYIKAQKNPMMYSNEKFNFLQRKIYSLVYNLFKNKEIESQQQFGNKQNKDNSVVYFEL